VIIYLLAQLASNTMTPAQLSEASKGYRGMSQASQEAAILFLNCAAATALGA
jgi:hypothetical protein